MARQKSEAKGAVTPSSRNVFGDLGFADAGERQTKVRLAFAINQILERRRLPQTNAARLLGVTQPKISALSNFRLEGFSVERLVHFLTALDQDVEIRTKPDSAAGLVVCGKQSADYPDSAVCALFVNAGPLHGPIQGPSAPVLLLRISTALHY